MRQQRYIARVGVYYEYHPLIFKLQNVLPSSNGMTEVMKFTRRQINNRMDASEAEKAQQGNLYDVFLEKLLKLHEEQPEKCSLLDVFSTCLANIGAGSETTSVSLSGILHNLISYPNTFQKVRHVLPPGLHVLT